ncbi:MAG: PEP-CTERM sorting domain-containing protein [Lentisphaerota bacterium]
MKTYWMMVGLAVCAGIAQGGLIWSEDFSTTSVTNWTVGSEMHPGSTITSDGNLGLFYVNGTNSLTAFIPRTGFKPFVPFNPAEKSQYTMTIVADSMTWSLSYDFALDQFDSGGGYLDTYWQAYPPAGTTTNIGTIQVNLGSMTFNSSAAYLMPKLDVHTGDGQQTLRLDSMSFDYTIPEPATGLLIVAGAAATGWIARRKARRTS